MIVTRVVADRSATPQKDRGEEAEGNFHEPPAMQCTRPRQPHEINLRFTGTQSQISVGTLVKRRRWDSTRR
jgi:hypothetical protein